MISVCPSVRCAVAATLLAAGGWAMAQAEVAPVAPAAVAAPTPTHPAWADVPVVITSRTTVSRVIPGKPADIVILRDGLSQGFRDGVLCVVQRNTSGGTINVAEVIVVATRSDQCAAYIDWPDDQTYQKNPIQPNDQVRIELH